jgi:hypothetical protein
MARLLKRILIFIIVLIIVLISLWLALPYWITPVSKLFLPENTAISIAQRPQLIKGGLSGIDLKFNAGHCTLAQLENGKLLYGSGQFTLTATSLGVEGKCLDQLPSSQSASSALALDEIIAALPRFHLQINRLNLVPWLPYGAAVELVNDGERQNLNYRSEPLRFKVTFDNKQQLTVESLQFLLPDSSDKLTLKGSVTVPISLDQLPQTGQIDAQFDSAHFIKPLLMAFNWNKPSGTLTVKEQDSERDLINFPLSLAPHKLAIEKGQWSWPYAEMPLSGGLSLAISDWNSDYSAAVIEGRMNLLTSGHGGKANLVLSVGPDPIKLTENKIRFQLTGKAGFADIATYITVPGIIEKNLLDPVVRLQSGSLLRATGKLSPDITLQEARFPLAGVWLTLSGINGRLQAIVNAKHRQWGAYKLHLDGKSENFFVDQGLWQWKFWGNGNVPTLKGKWDVAGTGRWQDSLIKIDTMSTGFNELAYGRVKVQAPRFELTQPLIWQRDKEEFSADLELQARKVSFTSGGFLPKASLSLSLKGPGPNNFVWNGQLLAKPIGPIRLNGRWDGQRLRGEAWWPKQSLRVFQSLLAADSGIKIRQGTLRAQAAFSAAETQGFEAGGHFVVEGGSLWLKDGELNGLDFTASYLLKNHVWQLGNKEPIKLKINRLNNLFDMHNITANLRGYYPYSNKRPLILDNVAVDMLGGHVSLSEFKLPQQQPTTIKVDNVELSELFTVLKPKQLAMSGRVSGELPLFIDNPDWLVKDGWIENTGSLTLRLDQQFVDAIAEDNAITGAVMDWLRYMEISRSRADVNVSNLGVLEMDVQIKGVNSVKSKEKPVILNYHHEENIFQLWRSLRFGDNLQDWVEQQLSSNMEKEN